jgi:Flp pilus assembly protein CpaB
VVVKRSNRLLILLGLLIAMSAAVATVVVVSSNTGGGGDKTALASPTPTLEPDVEVVASQVAIPAGTTIKAEMLKMKSIKLSDRDAQPGTFSSIDQVVGKIAGANIDADKIIIATDDFYAPGSVTAGKSLKDSISPGMLGVSMEVDQTNGVGTLLVPGDHVDVILSVYYDMMSITVPSSTDKNVNITASGSQLTSKMIFQNCRILATLLPPDNAAPTVAAPAAAGSAVPSTAKPTSPIVQFTGRHMIVVLEVFPDQAEVIRWAQRAEKLDPQNYITLGLGLRSGKDDGADIATEPGLGKPIGITFAVLVAVYGVLPADPLATLPKALAAKVQW